jgi:hypothetical protein
MNLNPSPAPAHIGDRLRFIKNATEDPVMITAIEIQAQPRTEIQPR